MTGRVRVRLRGTVPVVLPPAAACELFTPEGRRGWAGSWDPSYPAAPGKRLEPGTVFLTRPDRPTTWVAVHYDPGREVVYARVSGTATAGTVRVRCVEAPDRHDRELEAFAARFDDYLEHWRAAIDRSLGAPSGGG